VGETFIADSLFRRSSTSVEKFSALKETESIATRARRGAQFGGLNYEEDCTLRILCVLVVEASRLHDGPNYKRPTVKCAYGFSHAMPDHLAAAASLGTRVVDVVSRTQCWRT